MALRTLFAFGTRPEAIKLAPVISACLRDPEFEVRICGTGQHSAAMVQALELFGIEAHHRLALMEENQDLTGLAARGLTALQRVIREESADVVLVQGDTTSCLVASLAAFHERVPVGHVEAGLRTGDPDLPFPEEMNRRLVDCLSRLCFAPTEAARANLLRENIEEERVWLTGNTVVDALRMIQEGLSDAVGSDRTRGESIEEKLGIRPESLLLLVTMHRRESFGEAMKDALRGVRHVVRENENVEVVFPVHPNPHVQAAVAEVLEGTERVHLISPVDYVSLVRLLQRSRAVLTDSGGIQEESAVLGRPVLVTRRCTERAEGVADGAARVVGTDAAAIAETAGRLLRDDELYRKMARPSARYGDGHAAARIVEALRKSFVP